MHSTNLVTIGKIVEIKGRYELTHEYRRDRLPEPKPRDLGNRPWDLERLQREDLPVRDRTQERKDLDALNEKIERDEQESFPTFLFTFPDLSDSNKTIRDLERALTKRLGGGFTEWKARGAWSGPEGFTFESVRVYLVSTDKERELRLIVKGFLDILGEKEGYFVTVGQHTIL